MVVKLRDHRDFTGGNPCLAVVVIDLVPEVAGSILYDRIGGNKDGPAWRIAGVILAGRGWPAVDGNRTATRTDEADHMAYPASFHGCPRWHLQPDLLGVREEGRGDRLILLPIPNFIERVPGSCRVLDLPGVVIGDVGFDIIRHVGNVRPIAQLGNQARGRTWPLIQVEEI